MILPLATERLRPSADRPDGLAMGLIGHLSLARGFRGGERQAQLLIQELAARGVHQRLIARAGEPLAARASAIDQLDVCETAGSLLAAARACRGCALVHVHDGRSVHAAALARALYGVPYVITRRVDNPIRNNLLTRRAYRGAAAIAVLSGAIDAQVKALDAALVCQRIPDATSPHRCDEHGLERLRERYAGRFVVGHIGALDHSHKGQRDIFAAAQELAATHPAVTFVLLGSGVDGAAFRALAAQQSNVELAGQVDNVGDYLVLFDAFVFPSLHEGMGSTLLDAMAFALPIVATSVGGIVDLIRDGQNGILIEPSRPDALRDAVARLHDDPALARRLGDAGRRVAQDHSPGVMADRYLDLYRTVFDNQMATTQA